MSKLFVRLLAGLTGLLMANGAAPSLASPSGLPPVRHEHQKPLSRRAILLHTLQKPGADMIAAFTPDGKSLVVGTEYGRESVDVGILALWDVRRGRRRQILLRQPIRSLAVSPDGHTIACTADAEHPTRFCRLSIYTWDLRRGVRPREIPNLAPIRYFTPDGRFLAVDGGEGLQFYDPVMMKQKQDLDASDTACSPDSLYIAEIVWRPEGEGLDPEQIYSVDILNARSGVHVRVYRNPFANQIFDYTNTPFFYLRNGRWLVLGSHLLDTHSKRLRFWSLLKAGGRKAFVPYPLAGGVAVTFTAQRGRTLEVWDVMHDRHLHSWHFPREIMPLALSPNGHMLAAVEQGQRSSLELWMLK